jgi:hypothetical protein
MYIRQDAGLIPTAHENRVAVQKIYDPFGRYQDLPSKPDLSIPITCLSGQLKYIYVTKFIIRNKCWDITSKFSPMPLSIHHSQAFSKPMV